MGTPEASALDSHGYALMIDKTKHSVCLYVNIPVAGKASHKTVDFLNSPFSSMLKIKGAKMQASHIPN